MVKIESPSGRLPFSPEDGKIKLLTWYQVVAVVSCKLRRKYFRAAVPLEFAGAKILLPGVGFVVVVVLTAAGVSGALEEEVFPPAGAVVAVVSAVATAAARQETPAH